MKIRLPASSISRGELRLRFRRIPEQSLALHAYLSDKGSSQPDWPLASTRIYGRGIGSNAKEQVIAILRFDAQVMNQVSLRGGEVLDLRLESLDGQPIDDSALDLLEVIPG